MLSWVLLAALGAAPTQPAARDSEVVLTAAALERLRLPAAPSKVVSDEWAQEVLLTVGTAGPEVRRALARGRSKLCPKVELRGAEVVLHCRGGLVVGRAVGSALELKLLRGLPWADSGVLRFHYPPERFGLGEPCPGSTPAGRGECLLADGKVAEAKALFQGALETAQGSFASMRLGDLALAVEGDPVAALARYQAAGKRGAAGRLSSARTCEVTACVSDAFDSLGLPEPARTELDLRRARALALAGQPGAAASLLSARLADPSRPSGCALWGRACAGLVRMALEAPDLEDQAEGLAAFMRLREEDPAAATALLVRRAADAAAGLGAGRFAANLMASVTPSVPLPELDGHLRRTARLYDSVGDRVRGDVIREYALARLGRRHRPGAAPSASPAPPDPTLPFEALVGAAAHELELASAFGAISRARTAREPATSP